jgi:ABC-type nitrate/sulfonate/bicarbonate transport system substrate-binding protein
MFVKSTLASVMRGGLATVALALAGWVGQAAAEEKITVFLQPIVPYDSVWMADERGFFKEEGLNITFRLFPSGTTALQSFRAGEGDILLGGDFPGVQYWANNNKDYRLIAAIDRDPSSYIVTANKKIKRGEDLRGKKVATRVGSTVDWFLAVYLKKHGLSKNDVTVVNLDGQVMPAALCRGDIDAFFFWQPYNDTALQTCPDLAHNLSDADGYIPGYSIAAARPDWLQKKPRIAEAFLRAMIKGSEVAKKDKEAVIAYADKRLSMPRDIVEAQWPVKNRIIALNDVVYKDYCELAEWMRSEKLLPGKLDLNEFVWTEGLKAVDPSRVTAPPAPC